MCAHEVGAADVSFPADGWPPCRSRQPCGCYFISTPCSVYLTVISENITMLQGKGRGISRKNKKKKKKVRIWVKQKIKRK